MKNPRTTDTGLLMNDALQIANPVVYELYEKLNNLFTNINQY